VETGGHGDRTFRGQDLIVVSPGVPFDAPQLVQARNLGEPVIGEIELAAQFLAGSIVAITGERQNDYHSLAGEILTAGSSYACGGNIGTPAISLWIRLGLRRGRCWRCRVSAGDDRHVSSADCGDSEHHSRPSGPAQDVCDTSTRRHVFENQGADDFTVLNADDPTTVDWRGEREGS